ncbi:MAG: hypothetical protein IPO92_11830 [Saprospiraceae bacterium]|nr:hypothetical protein [Saprospiraceae bacterium]
MFNFIKNIFGSKYDRDVKGYSEVVVGLINIMMNINHFQMINYEIKP